MARPRNFYIASTECGQPFIVEGSNEARKKHAFRGPFKTATEAEEAACWWQRDLEKMKAEHSAKQKRRPGPKRTAECHPLFVRSIF